MFSTLWASFWSNLSFFHEKNENYKKIKKIFFFEKKFIFCFLTFSRIFQEVKKSGKFCVFSRLFSGKWNLRNVFELKFWHEKLISFDENIFGAFYRLLLRLKNCFIFLSFMPMFWTNLKKKNENLKKNSKNLQFLKFHLWFCGRNFGQSAENSVKNIDLPKICTKTILSKIRPLHHQNIQKVDPPPQK